LTLVVKLTKQTDISRLDVIFRRFRRYLTEASSIRRFVMFKRVMFLTAVFASVAAAPASAHNAFLGWPSDRTFNPYKPYSDSAILFPTAHGPVPVHVRVYSVPLTPPYYNVPPYIVLDP
jgi:hypothetical protein